MEWKIHAVGFFCRKEYRREQSIAWSWEIFRSISWLKDGAGHGGEVSRAVQGTGVGDWASSPPLFTESLLASQE